MTRARMRTIREALSLIKEMDAETAVTYNFILTLCKKGLISSVSVGKKILLNYDELLSYLHIDGN